MRHNIESSRHHDGQIPRNWSRRRVLVWALSCTGLTTLAACRPVQPPPEQAAVTDTPPAPSPTVTESATPTSVATESATATPTATATTEPTATPVPPPAGPPAEVNIQLFAFQPAELEISPNTAVIWTNRDDIEHSVTSGIPDAPDGLFDSGLFVLDEQFTYTFTVPGEYAYFCTRHPHMIGTVIVTGETSA